MMRTQKKSIKVKRKKYCQHHGTCGLSMDKCTTLKALVKQAKQNFQKKKGSPCMRSTSKKHTEELRAFEKISVSNSDQESFNNSSSEEGKI